MGVAAMGVAFSVTVTANRQQQCVDSSSRYGSSNLRPMSPHQSQGWLKMRPLVSDALEKCGSQCREDLAPAEAVCEGRRVMNVNL